MAHTYRELPSADQGGDCHIIGSVADLASADQRHLSRVCVGGGRSLPEGVLQQTEVATTYTAILVIMERGIGVEIAKASSISSLPDMEDAIGPCQTRVANWWGVGVEHHTIGGGGGLLLGADHAGRAIP